MCKVRQLPKWRFIKRAIRFWWQRRTRGWDDSETWNLDVTIAKFAAPRLKRFKELNNGHPHCLNMDTEEKWDSAIDEMIWALDNVAKDNIGSPEYAMTESDRCENGLKLFGEWFRALWW